VARKKRATIAQPGYPGFFVTVIRPFGGSEVRPVQGMQSMWQSLATALCLVLVLEGLMPFLAPGRWKRMLISVIRVSDGQLRIIGFCSMLAGTLLLYLVR